MRLDDAPLQISVRVVFCRLRHQDEALGLVAGVELRGRTRRRRCKVLLRSCIVDMRGSHMARDAQSTPQ